MKDTKAYDKFDRDIATEFFPESFAYYTYDWAHSHFVGTLINFQSTQVGHVFKGIPSTGFVI